MAKILDRTTKESGAADPILTRIVNEDKVHWYKKPNLRLLYFLLFPTCMGVELTSGFDSQLINALQIVPSWIKCMSLPTMSKINVLTCLSSFRQPARVLEGYHCRSILPRSHLLPSICSYCQRQAWKKMVNFPRIMCYDGWRYHSRLC